MEVGKCYFVRSVTDYWLGRVVSIDGPYTVTLEDACWVANSGRLTEFLKNGRSDGMEIEPIPDGMKVQVQWLAVIGPWTRSLLRETV